MQISLRYRKELQKIMVAFISLVLIFFFLYNPNSTQAEVQISTNDNEAIGNSPLTNRNLELFKKDELLYHLRNHHLTPPAGTHEQYNISVSYPHYREHDQYHKALLQLLETHHKIEGGFFVEAGALDGQYLSHSLELEMKYQWNGLLVEASPNLTRQLKSKRRKCWSADVCLTGESYMKIDYLAKKDQHVVWKRGNGKINPLKYGVEPRVFEGSNDYESEGEVECFSLFSLLTALKVEMVDLLVLDIEGHEFEVLSKYPLHEIPIKVIAVEHWLMPVPSETVKKLMFANGYKLVYESDADYVFVKK